MSTALDSSGLPENVRHHLEQAYAYEEGGDLECALRECERIIQLAPELAEAHNLRGVILDELGRKEEAIAAYREAVRLDPTFREARENLDEATAETGKREKVELVTVRAFIYPVHAHLAKALLEANGIRAFVADDGIATVNLLFSKAIGGVRLLVRDQDALAARRILEQSARPRDQGGSRGAAENPQCPRCHSAATHFEKYGLRLLALTWLLLGIPFPFVLRRWRCERCGYTWREREG